jgi:hypothetical protein
VNLDRFGLLHDARRGLIKAQQRGGSSSKQPAIPKGPGGVTAAALERLFEAAVAAKKKKKKKKNTGGSKLKTKVKPKPSKPAAKKPAKTKAKSKPKKANSPTEKREELKKKFELVDFAEDITQMSLTKLREHFGYRSGKINKALFANNVIWQVFRQIRDGRPPAYFATGGSIRCFWYIVKGVVQEHPRVFNVEKDLDGLFSKQLVQMIKLGLLSYKDLNIIDDRKGFRKLAPLYGNPHIILLGEKFSFLSKLTEVALQYGITIQCSKGMPSLVMADTMITEMAEAGYDMSQEFVILTFTDFDPTGWNIGNTFVRHLKQLGIKNVRTFDQYPTRRSCLDVVCPHELPSDFVERARLTMRTKLQRAALTKKWAIATGGLYKRGGTEYAVSAEEHLEVFDQMLAEKIAPFLRQKPEAFTRLINLEYLSETMGQYLLERVLTVPPTAEQNGE